MIKEALGKLVAGQSLAADEAAQVMDEVMEGKATPAQLAAFLVALRMKGETEDEVLGMVRTMRAKSLHVDSPGDLLDTCGTGGDGTGTFNISTAAGLVAAAAGVKVAKHGNRSASSKCGSADVLEALGARLAVTPAQAREALDKVGFAFLFAQAYHPAMRHAGPTRGEIGIRTVFNIMGPLANPAAATHQLLGVAEPSLLPKMAYVLGKLGVKRAMVVHGRDGLDEISLSAETDVRELDGERTTVSVLSPEQLGVPRASLQDLAGGDKAENAQIIRDLFGGAQGPKRNALLVNAGAALYVAGKAGSIRDGMVLAAQTIDSGAAARTLDAYVKVTQGLPKRLGGAVDQYSVAKTGKVFQVLRSAAKAHKTLTYAEVGVQAGMHPRAVSPCLHEIQAWCDAWRLPHISALVVVKETQLPTRSYSPDGNVMTPEKFEALKQEVFQFNWDPVRFSP